MFDEIETEEQKKERVEWQKLRHVSASSLIATFDKQPTTSEMMWVEELVEMTLHKQQVAALVANTFDEDYKCDISFCMRYTANAGGESLLKGIYWLLEKLRKDNAYNILGEAYLAHLVKLHKLKKIAGN